MDLNTSLRLDLTKSRSREVELENINQMLKDEYQALQLAFTSLEEKLRKAQVFIVKQYLPTFGSNRKLITDEPR